MSKINQQQAKALKETATPVVAQPEKADAPSKATAAKTVTAKTATVKTAAVKATAVKDVAPKAKEITKPVKQKTPKLKMERDSFTMPKTEYAQFSVLKERLLKLGQPAKKSELLRAGIMQLTAMTDTALKAALGKVPTIKTGRPNK
jgi:hypothetical protein